VPKRDAAGEVHNLINKERHKRGLPHVYWSREMYRLAKDQANYCAKVGRLVHSKRFAFQGGENLCGGRGKFSPKTIVGTWMRSKAGHREYLLSPRVRKAAVAIATSKRGNYAAWAFSDKSPDPHDCPYYKTPRPKFKTSIRPKTKGGGGMLRLPIKVILICASIFAIVLGAHGVYVYFSRLELLFGGEASKLFLALEVPVRLQAPIEWMSFKGLQSWFIPAVFIFIGLVIWYWQSNIYVGNVSGWFRKLHLW